MQRQIDRWSKRIVLACIVIAALFGVTGLTVWPRGGYAFYAVDDTGIGRYLYACLRV